MTIEVRGIMIKITHIIMVIALFGINKVYAWQAPWTFTPSSLSHNIFLSAENTPTVGRIPLDSGAYIGVFFLDDEQQFQNAGFTQWQGTDTFITAYGDDGTTDGFQTDEEFQFRVWRPSEGCEVVEFEVEYLQGGIYTSMGRFEPDGISGISSLDVRPSRVAYFITEMCKNDTINLPVFSTQIVPFTFSAPEGLDIDRNTGAIDPSQSDPGTYTIGVNSNNVCLAFGFISNEITVNVNDLPQVDLPDTISGCETVRIGLSDGEGNSYSWSTGDTSSELVTSESGMYTVQVTNTERCFIEESINIIVSPPINIENARFETHFVPCQTAGRLFVDPGSVQGGITPFTFIAENVDGTVFTSTNGVFEGVPEGDYFVIFEDSIGCTREIPGFEFRNEQSCETAVLTPNNDGSLESLFIEESGLAQVFDRNGIVRKELAIPAYWDGKNDAGDVLPMGTYLIVVNGRKKMTVTIVR